MFKELTLISPFVLRLPFDIVYGSRKVLVQRFLVVCYGLLPHPIPRYRRACTRGSTNCLEWG
jgi:hypothetical protein